MFLITAVLKKTKKQNNLCREEEGKMVQKYFLLSNFAVLTGKACV